MPPPEYLFRGNFQAGPHNRVQGSRGMTVHPDLTASPGLPAALGVPVESRRDSPRPGLLWPAADNRGRRRGAWMEEGAGLTPDQMQIT